MLTTRLLPVTSHHPHEPHVCRVLTSECGFPQVFNSRITNSETPTFHTGSKFNKSIIPIFQILNMLPDICIVLAPLFLTWLH